MLGIQIEERNEKKTRLHSINVTHIQLLLINYIPFHSISLICGRATHFKSFLNCVCAHCLDFIMILLSIFFSNV